MNSKPSQDVEDGTFHSYSSLDCGYESAPNLVSTKLDNPLAHSKNTKAKESSSAHWSLESWDDSSKAFTVNNLIERATYEGSGRGTSQTTNLQRHLRTAKIHNKDTIFVCEWVGCGKRYSRSDARKRHFRAAHQSASELQRPTSKPQALVPVIDFGGSTTNRAHEVGSESNALDRVPRLPVIDPQDSIRMFCFKDHPQNRSPDCSDMPNIPEATEGIEALIPTVSESHTNDHCHEEDGRPSDKIAYSSDLMVDSSIAITKSTNSAPEKVKSTSTQRNLRSKSCILGRHPESGNEDDDFCISGNEQPQITPTKMHTGQVGARGQSSDDSASPLSSDKNSPASSSDNGYDSASDRGAISGSQEALISRLMDEICSSFYFQASHQPKERGQDRQGTRKSSSDGTDRTNTPQDCSQESSIGRRKRVTNDDEDLEGEDDGRQRRRRFQHSRNDDGDLTEVRYFACPFHKYDRSTYGSGNMDPRIALKYRSCGPPGWPTIGKLKEHLYRNHQTPIHCPRCWTTMKTEAALGEHARASSQCSVQPQSLRWIPREVYEKLKNRKKAFAGQNDEDTWRYVFGLLFPESPRIPSPYYDDVTTLEEAAQSNSPTSHAIAEYEVYARAHLPRLVEEALEATVAEQTQPIEEGLRRALSSIVRDCHTRLAQNYLLQRPSSLSATGLQAEVLPSFYIEPLSLTSDVSFTDPSQITNKSQGVAQALSDSGYASAETSLHRDNDDHFGNLELQNGLGPLYGIPDDDHCNSDRPDFMLEHSDWAGLMESSENVDLFGNDTQYPSQ